MPMINGIKMACEPCIRGHRSTKCNHSAERVMLPVRKPGRPLSICPHPPNNGCTCATTSVTAAIPRTRKCGCGSNGGGSSSRTGSGAVTKPQRSPTRRSLKSPTSPKFQTQSPVDTGAFERTDFSQMSIRALPNGWPNANGQPSAMDNLSVPVAAGQPQNGGHFVMSGNGLSYFAGQAGQPAVFTANTAPFQNSYPMQAPTNGHMYIGNDAGYDSFFGSNMDMSTGLGDMQLPGPHVSNQYGMNIGTPVAYTANQGSTDFNKFDGFQLPQMASTRTITPVQETTQPAASTAKASCCVPATQEPLSRSAHHTPTSSTNSLSSIAGTATSKGCCSTSSVSSPSLSAQHPMLKSESMNGVPGSVNLSSIPSLPPSDVKTTSITNGHVLNGQYTTAPMDSSAANGTSTSLPPVPLSQQAYATFAQEPHGAPAWYKYPPEYGTVTAPLQPSQWRRNLTVTAGPNAETFHPGLQTFAGPAAMQQTYSAEQQNSVVAEDFSHMCSCGDDCECIGCVAHPYNNATRNTVQAVWSMIDDASSTASSATTATATVATAATLTSGVSPQQLGGSGSSGGGGGGGADSGFSQVPTPSDTSGVSEELPATDFLFVSYSVIGCDGEGLTCPCGDDCQCVGCTIHNNVPS